MFPLLLTSGFTTSTPLLCKTAGKAVLPGGDWKELAVKENPEATRHLAVAKDGVAGTNIPASSGVLEAVFPSSLVTFRVLFSALHP